MEFDDRLREQGFCILRDQFPVPLIDACRAAFWPIMTGYLETHAGNRGPHRHFLPMPFEAPCFAPEFFFDPLVLALVCGAMGESVVADQWACDVPVRGSQFQSAHVDYQRPLFTEEPDLVLPPYVLVVSFGLVDITAASGPIEIAPGTHRMPRGAAVAAVECGQIHLEPQLLARGDVLIRHPWAVHRGTPNCTAVPRPLLTIRYVRRWYADASREVHAIPDKIWNALTEAQQKLMRFPVISSAAY